MGKRMNVIDKILEKNKVLIIDGATGTWLQEKGYDVSDSLWSAKFLMENPSAISQVHKDYLEAGSDCITTLSYQATFEGFKERGLNEEESSSLLQSSVTLAIKERDLFWSKNKNNTDKAKPLVAASVGPYGAYLADGSEFRGDYSLGKEELITFHRKRMKTLLDAKPDLLACETVPCLLEAKAYVELLEEFPTANAWISFSAKDDKHINSGESIKECAKYLDSKDQVLAIGINCTAPAHIKSLINEIKEVTKKPIIVYPNGGSVYDSVSKTWSEDSTSNSYGKMAATWKDDGASIIGGCCQTTPKDIKEIFKYLKQN